MIKSMDLRTSLGCACKTTPWNYRREDLEQCDPLFSWQNFRLIPGLILVKSVLWPF